MKTMIFLLGLLGFVMAQEASHSDSCLVTIPNSLGLNICLGDSLGSILRKYKLTKSKNPFGHIYWSAQLKLRNVLVYLQCYFEKGKLVDISIIRNTDLPCDSANIFKEIESLNNEINRCFNKSFENIKQNGYATTFDTSTPMYRVNYMYLNATSQFKQCGFNIEIQNILTDLYRIKEEEVDKILQNMK
jgi:hypothetical protein